MDLTVLFDIADRARARAPLTPQEKRLVRKGVPEAFGAWSRRGLPATVRHPAGFTVKGASVGTFVQSALLLAGQRVLGRRYGELAFYTKVERDLALGIMRSHFHNGYPKGTYCCTQCTLAVYPVLEANAIRYFECPPLARAVKQVIARRQWRFATPPPPAMLAWALSNHQRSRAGD